MESQTLSSDHVSEPHLQYFPANQKWVILYHYQISCQKSELVSHVKMAFPKRDGSSIQPLIATKSQHLDFDNQYCQQYFFHLKYLYDLEKKLILIPKTAISNKMLLNRTLHAYFDQSPKSNHFNVKAKLYTECFTFKLKRKFFDPFLSMHLLTIFIKNQPFVKGIFWLFDECVSQG